VSLAAPITPESRHQACNENATTLSVGVQRNTRGYRSIRNLITMIYLLTGKPEFNVLSI